jgi:hypothetical protein
MQLCQRWYFHAFCSVFGGKKNDKSFKDYKRMVVEQKYFSFNTLYLWTAAFVFPNLVSFQDFLVLFSPSSWVFLMLSIYLGYCFLMIFQLLIIKKTSNSNENKCTTRTINIRIISYFILFAFNCYLLA